MADDRDARIAQLEAKVAALHEREANAVLRAHGAEADRAEALDQQTATAEALREALALVRTYGERQHEAYALWIAAQITPDGSESEGLYGQALAIAKELGMRPLQAHCHLGLGKLYRRTGRPDEAGVELQTAVAMLREMGMAFWLPEAEKELAGVSG